MGMTLPSSTVTIHQTVLSSQFTQYDAVVTDPDQKVYDLGFAVVTETDVVLLNGLYQARIDAYQQVGTTIQFNVDTILTIGDILVVYYEKQI